MAITDFARPGDKIDITYLHQNNGKVYKSSVFDFLGENVMEIGMPTEGGRMVLFQVGFECSMFFYTQKGMYTCEAKVLDRYKKDGFYMMSVKIISIPKKYQRRDFYRVETSIDFYYYKITKEVSEMETTEDLFEEITNPKYIPEKKLAHTLDISGGGVKFLADEELESLGLTKEQFAQILNIIKENTAKQFFNKWALVGADIGASAGIIAADKMKSYPEVVVMISPVVETKGVYIPVSVAHLETSDFLAILGTDDTDSADAAGYLSKFAQNQFVTFTSSSKTTGMMMIKNDPGLSNFIAEWVSEYLN